MTTKSLLIELLVEELPPKSLQKLGAAFGELLFAELRNSCCLGDDAKLTTFASPRRLAAHVTNVLPEGAHKPRKVKLMPVSIAFDVNGGKTPALIKKLKSLELEYLMSATQTVWDMRISQEHDGKVESLFYSSLQNPSSHPLGHSVQIALHQIDNNLPIPKAMTYPNPSGDGWETVNFVRPAHRLVALYGTEVMLVDPRSPDRPVVMLGLQAGRTTRGHRFEAASATLDICDADSYEAQMENEGAVIPSFEKRRAEIVRQLTEAAVKVGGGVKPIADGALLDEVTALVERPNVLAGKFDAAFLKVPQECLILTMKSNQKYFPLLDTNGKLTNQFLIVSNIRPADTSMVINGNERVLQARLADARFFFDQDRKKPLDSHVLDLAKVVYHNKLGSQGERVQRVQSIAIGIATELGGEELARQAEQAALLAKADLLTNMVSEFPELQGIMGRYYAQQDGVNDDIAYAIEDHYKPRFAGDELPRNMVGICVALADKLTTLIDMFGIGEIPTGDKDPFALRRHALGAIRMLIERDLPLGLNWLFHAARLIDARVIKALSDFIYDRLAGSLREQGYSAQEVDAVLSLRPQLLIEVPKRLAAVRAFAALPEAAALAATNKRVGNILKKAEGNLPLRQAWDERLEIDTKLLHEPAEQALHQVLSRTAPKAEAAFVAGDYTASLQALAALKEPIDTFFDKVMVNTEDVTLRANRLALLLQLQQAMNRVADISKLAT